MKRKKEEEEREATTEVYKRFPLPDGFFRGPVMDIYNKLYVIKSPVGD